MAGSHNLSSVIIHGGFPIPLYWWGWSTNTHLLKANKWEIMAAEVMHDYSHEWLVSIGAKSPDNKMIIQGRIAIPMSMLHGAFGSGQGQGEPILNFLSRAGVPMQQYTSTDKFVQIDPFDLDGFNRMRPINPYGSTSTSRAFSDLKCFEYLDEGPSIYIPPSSENELLDMLLKVQYPNQQEIKKRLILPETKPIIKAQIFSLVA